MWFAESVQFLKIHKRSFEISTLSPPQAPLDLARSHKDSPTSRRASYLRAARWAWLRASVVTARTAASPALGSPRARRGLPAQRVLAAPGRCETLRPAPRHLGHPQWVLRRLPFKRSGRRRNTELKASRIRRSPLETGEGTCDIPPEPRTIKRRRRRLRWRP
uniref:Uncharacterized protein n=1 Tax=Rangifer tarandus platyrhynchus TaxID=3082113 RepID=A0ACB0FF31_RANTA|nr:unnamed protein product [Rangifer tarandus platyrhynchus]